MITVKIVPTTTGPAGKLADAELHFWPGAGALAGLKLIGFAIWESRYNKGYNVTFPARSYSVNGDRRSFALLRPVSDVSAQTAIRDLILDTYRQYVDGPDPEHTTRDQAEHQAAAVGLSAELQARRDQAIADQAAAANPGAPAPNQARNQAAPLPPAPSSTRPAPRSSSSSSTRPRLATSQPGQAATEGTRADRF